MSEKEKKKSTAKLTDKPTASKQVDNSQSKSNGKEAGNVQKSESKASLDKKGSKSSLKEKSAEPSGKLDSKAKLKSKKTLDEASLKLESKPSVTVEIEQIVPEQIQFVVDMIAQEFENLTSTYNKTISNVILQIWSDTTTKSSLQQSFYFYRMQDVLLKGTVKVLQDYFSSASSNLNQALLKLGQKTSTLNSSLAKSFISADEANQRSLKIENQIKSALSAHCKDEEARDDKRFTVISGNDDDVQN